jgi:Tat protein secretion system quality control protein TatD with DNase activity
MAEYKLPSNNEEPFPWHLGVYDAHCHPTDTMSSLAHLATMKPLVLTIMATRAEDQALVAEAAAAYPLTDPPSAPNNAPCQILPSFGWHPWFSHLLYDDTISTPAAPTPSPLTPAQKAAHYASVLHPPATDPSLLAALPTPQPLSAYLATTRARLLAHPRALVGEIGLDRTFRIPVPDEADTSSSDPPRSPTAAAGAGAPAPTPGSRAGRRLTPHHVTLAHQRAVLAAQLALAAELGRAVSVHGVGAHGALFDALAERWRGWERHRESRRERRREGAGGGGDDGYDDDDDDDDDGDGSVAGPGPATAPPPYPPRICLHSFSGPVESLKPYLSPRIPATIFFSFSRAINLSTPAAARAVEAIKAVPARQILVESDLHVAGEEMEGELEAMVRVICAAKGWGLREGVGLLGENWRAFVGGFTG